MKSSNLTVQFLKNYSKSLDTGIVTEVVNGRVEVYSALEYLKKSQQSWWETVINNYNLN